MTAWTLWLIVAGIFFVLEFATEGILFCWFGVGAIVAIGISFLTDNFIIQFLTFTVVSILLVICSRKFAKKVEPKVVPTNVYTIIGKKAIVTTAIDNVKGQGQVKVDGDIWSAKAENDEVIPEGESVEIVKIDGVKTIVKKI